MKTKGLLMDVKRFAVHDGPGIRTTLFLKGCSLRCLWCHNPEGIFSYPQLAFYEHKCVMCRECIQKCPQHAHVIMNDSHWIRRDVCEVCGQCAEGCLGDALVKYGQEITIEEAVRIAIEDMAFYGDKGGVTLSGGEPLLQHEFVCSFLTQMKQFGIHTAVDTCGNVPWEAFEATLPYTDLFLYDVKHVDPEIHRQLTGCSNKQILANLQALSSVGANVEVRIPLVPGYNDDMKTLCGFAELISSLKIQKVKILPYHSFAHNKYQALNMQDTLPSVASPTDMRLCEVKSHLMSMGINAISG